MKRTWTKPTFQAHQSRSINKFGRAPGAGALHEQVDGVSVRSLLAEYGSPLFILSERTLRRKARELQRAFKTRYPKVIHGWSYKTNYLNAVCRILHEEGAWAEVVSQFEYEKARALGVPGHRILFNGPGKKRPILERALREGAHLHVDHLEELYLIQEIARSQQKKAAVTLRLNFATGYAEPWTRFGFNIESGEAMAAARLLQGMKHLRLTGLHSHIGTFITDPRAYEAQVRIMLDFLRAVERETKCQIETLDIGGGFPSLNALQGVYLPPEQTIPSLDQYAETICRALHEGMRGRDELPTLILESGRAVVDEAGWLAATVIGSKRLPDGRRALIIDAGVNLLFTAFWYNHPVKPAQPAAGVPEETALYGPLCMNIDVLRQSVMLPPLKAGESLVFHPAGAYNNTQWMQFIEYRPNVVLIDEQGRHWVVRSAETLETLNRLERLPAHLEKKR